MSSPSPAPAAPARPATRSIIYLGMDVHKDSITIAVLGRTRRPPRGAIGPNDLPKLKKWLDRVARDGELRATRSRRVAPAT